MCVCESVFVCVLVLCTIVQKSHAKHENVIRANKQGPSRNKKLGWITRAPLNLLLTRHCLKERRRNRKRERERERNNIQELSDLPEPPSLRIAGVWIINWSNAFVCKPLAQLPSSAGSFSLRLCFCLFRVDGYMAKEECTLWSIKKKGRNGQFRFH